MSLVKLNGKRFPWNERLIDFFNRDAFVDDDFFNLEKTHPSMNVKEHKDGFEIEFAAPGFEKKDFKITIKDDVLEVSAQKEKEETEEEENFTRREFNYNAFTRTLQLPASVDRSKEVKAVYKNGILGLKVLKMEEAKKEQKKIIEVV
ncbi:Hsp20/alpha crystallin family protein [Flagellimonas halotolerans]|uniref:Hsp20/alpha crystallin family protein n=1 Tax=Flagellimonas halotolerans TaxID=3112164 RepID=A0ABU6IT49_9FLAO|nr:MULTISPECIES: Hsp20/alpha crystallin family protein [unclassified Allomuricauda]MEC3966440.1 Hsp20/alpha crystallin family protein [Muricauda sp. SYSU M86414]MEC4266305.1 Hsp20/alpha crystallin family protein [Muricauda sp. SYSU M84420]